MWPPDNGDIDMKDRARPIAQSETVRLNQIKQDIEELKKVVKLLHAKINVLFNNLEFVKGDNGDSEQVGQDHSAKS